MKNRFSVTKLRILSLLNFCCGVFTTIVSWLLRRRTVECKLNTTISCQIQILNKITIHLVGRQVLAYPSSMVFRLRLFSYFSGGSYLSILYQLATKNGFFLFPFCLPPFPQHLPRCQLFRRELHYFFGTYHIR